MKVETRLFIAVFLLIALVLAACSAADPGNLPVSEPSPNSGNQGSADEPQSDQLPPVVAVVAREVLADYLNLPLEKIAILSIEQVEWSDSCLGLGGPAESCLAAITPGWRVELGVDDQIFIARTSEPNDAGVTIRFEGLDLVAPGLPPVPGEGGSDPDAASPDAALKARDFLAAVLQIDAEQVVILSAEPAEWSDGCLGLGGPAESCLAAITPGWRVELSGLGQIYVARTDQSAESIRLEELLVDLPVEPPMAQPPSDGAAPEAALIAREMLASRLDLPVEKVQIVSFSHTEWPDGCLGLPINGMMCTMAIVPGWRVELSADGQSFIARTNETGSMVKFE